MTYTHTHTHTHTHTNTIQSFKKKKEILSFETTWTDLEGTVLSEESQREKDKYCMISLICGIQKTATHRKRDQICGHQGWGVADGELAEAGQKVSVSSYIRYQFPVI